MHFACAASKVEREPAANARGAELEPASGTPALRSGTSHVRARGRSPDSHTPSGAHMRCGSQPPRRGTGGGLWSRAEAACRLSPPCRPPGTRRSRIGGGGRGPGAARPAHTHTQAHTRTCRTSASQPAPLSLTRPAAPDPHACVRTHANLHCVCTAPPLCLGTRLRVPRGRELRLPAVLTTVHAVRLAAQPGGGQSPPG